MSTKKFFIPVISFILLFAMCNSDKNTDENTEVNDTISVSMNTETIRKPFENLDVPLSEWELETSEAQTIEIPSGTKIEIPANAFVDANGNSVNQPVTIKYRELRSPAEIIASGITMDYDSAGVHNVFQTAGMFEIRGYADEKPVFVRDDKAITVKMASDDAGDYNFYTLDNEQGNWQFMNTTHTQPLENDGTENTMQKPVPPLKPVKFNSENDLVLQISPDYSAFPELKIFTGVMWKYAGDRSKEEIKNIFAKGWNSTDLEEIDTQNMQYKLTLSTKNGTKESVMVTPVLAGQNYERAMQKYSKKLEEYKSLVEANKLKKQSNNFYRTLRVNNFGIFNCDRIYRNPNLLRLAANFTIGDKYIDMLDKIDIYHITANNNVVVKYNNTLPGRKWNNFFYDPKTNNTLIAILPKNKVAVYSKEDFMTINQTEVENSEDFTFQMKELEEPISEISNFDEIIDKL